MGLARGLAVVALLALPGLALGQAVPGDQPPAAAPPATPEAPPLPSRTIQSPRDAKPVAAPTAAPSSSQKKTASSDVFDLLGELDEHAHPPPPPTSSRPSPAAHDPMAGVDLLS